ncbi:MAG: hypothetical protein E6I80_15300 [Chloroflexi bacterium]|nr:MAG: hypothetical protein E6I80_15300 [Chloroflexota bacterium]
MAGIGFRLQAMVAKGSYLEATTAYLSSAIITAGPWLAGVVALTVLGSATSTYLSEADRSLLFATIVSVFAASLLLASGPQMLVTRYLADRLYLNDTDSVAPTCAGVLVMIIPFFLITLPFLAFTPFDIRYRLLVITLFLTLTMTWIIVMLLSAARGYIRILVIFATCYTLGVGASIGLGHLFGLLGSLAGFTLGQMTCLSFLIVVVYLEFPSAQGISFAYLSYIRKFWDLPVIGVLYSLGIWVDSIIFWVSSRGQVISGFYHLFPPYDTVKFIVSLSTIPAAVIFMIHLEPNFHRHYQNYYQFIQTKGTLPDLVGARKGMIEAVRTGVGTILKVQGIVALFLCLLAQDVASFVGLAPRWVPLLRIETLAGVGQFFVFVMMLLLLYVDQRGATLLLVGAFMICNAFLTLASVYLGDAFYGMGFLGATIIGAIFGWFLLNARLQRLEYLTFMAQPMG